MSKSISQLAEQERAKLLEAIEAQANRISSKRDPQQTDISLSDWLNAAEKVIPNPKEPTNPATKAYQANAKDDQLFANKSEPSWDELFEQEPRLTTRQDAPARNLNHKTPSASPTSGKIRRTSKPNPAKTGPYFGVVVMLSLLLAMTGVLYLAYLVINDEFKRLETLVLDQEAQISQLETLVIDTQMLLEQHEDAPIVISLMQRLAELEAAQTHVDSETTAGAQISAEQLDALEAAQRNLEQQLQRALAMPQQPSSDVINQLEQQILQRLQQSSDALNLREAAVGRVDVVEPSTSIPTITPPTSPSAPLEPQVSSLDNQPDVVVVEEVITNPVYSARISNDMAWLEQQTGQHFVIQLAAMAQAERLEQLIRQHNLAQAKILPQVRNGQTRYILILGSYAQRQQAAEQANLIREQTGITPWIRRINDINGSLN